MKITVGVGPMDIPSLSAMAGGRTVQAGDGGEMPVAVTRVCTDSREVDGDTLLCVMRGERVDGHSYMASAHGAGCRVFLCERIPEGMPTPYVAILVEDTVTAMGRLAAGYRDTYLPALAAAAVTGSVGKTTTKECVAAVLARGGAVYKKDGNFNSVIGLPLTVLEMTPSNTRAVLEMGMSGFGEIAAMTRTVRPRVGMITNVGTSHMELLGSREGIAKAKSEILEGMGAGDTLLIHGDEPLLAPTAEMAVARGVTPLRVSLTDPTAPVYARITGSERGGMTFDLTLRVGAHQPATTWEGLHIPALGEHMVWAAAFAAATGYLMGMEREAVAAGLADYRTAAMRQSHRTVGDITLLEDCYNAAPESMRAALDVLSHANGRRIAVLGDMKELGDTERELHRGVGTAVAAHRLHLLVTVGDLGAEIGQGAISAGMPAHQVRITPTGTDYATVARDLIPLLQPGDTVLLKASRAMGLEALSAALEREYGGREYGEYGSAVSTGVRPSRGSAPNPAKETF